MAEETHLLGPIASNDGHLAVCPETLQFALLVFLPIDHRLYMSLNHSLYNQTQGYLPP